MTSASVKYTPAPLALLLQWRDTENSWVNNNWIFVRRSGVNYIWIVVRCSVIYTSHFWLPMMASSNGNICRVTGHLCGEFAGARWIPRTKASDAELWFFSLICVWINDWVNNRQAGDLRRHSAHYDVIAMNPMRVDNGHDDVIKWKYFPHNWPFVRGLHRSPVNSPHKGQWRGALRFSLICVWINGWINYREAGDLRRYYAHYDVTVMDTGLSVPGSITYAKLKMQKMHSFT